LLLGLPGSVGSIFVSRLSTALHAAALPTTPRTASHKPSARLVMTTLVFVTFPIEVIFLATIRALGWLHLPKGFIALSVLFFCIAVRSFRQIYVLGRAVLTLRYAGNNVLVAGTGTHKFSMEARARSRHVRHANPFGAHGPCRPASFGYMLRNRLAVYAERQGHAAKSCMSAHVRCQAVYTDS
jgi:hypothetical protein